MEMEWAKLSLIVGTLFGCVSAFLILLAFKWDIAIWYDTHRKKWMPERCEFCVGFWLSVVFYLILHHFTLWPAIIVGVVVNYVIISFGYIRP